MPRPLFDSPYIFGIHEPGGEQYMLDAGRPGWIVFTEAIGSEPNDTGGKDFRPWSDRNLGVICRLNNGYEPAGTIPNPARYADFARRCANYVANSPGCRIWIIGNEMNFAVERPPGGAAQAAASAAEVGRPLPPPIEPPSKPGFLGRLRGLFGGERGSAGSAGSEGGEGSRPAAQGARPDDHGRGSPERFNAIHNPPQAGKAFALPPAPPLPGADKVQPASDALFAAGAALSVGRGEPILPQMYADCYRQCRAAIRAVAGHGGDLVLVGPVAPWNDQTRYAGNELGDWVKYFQDILMLLGPDGCDGFALHTYTHGSDPNLVASDAKMNAPFQHRHYHLRAYRDFLAAVPVNMRHLPVYVTETDQDVEWLDSNNGWVQRAYGEIDAWNKQAANQPIRALALYRWPRIDKWYIEGKNGVIADFRAALGNDYKWPLRALTPIAFAAGDTARTLDVVNLRRTPGTLNKPAGDVLGQLAQGTEATIAGATHKIVDGIIWWNVNVRQDSGPTLVGWLAQATAAGVQLLEKVAAAVTPPVTPPSGLFRPGDRALTLDIVRMRQTPGFSNKPASDVVADIPKGATATILGGPRSADGLSFWQARARDAAGTERSGWMADTAPNGARLLQKAPSAPSEPIPAPGSFHPGDTVQMLDYVRFRRTPGFNSKPPADVIADLPPQTAATVVAGPQSVDGLTWWELDAPTPAGVQRGWAAETAPNAVRLLEKAASGTPVQPPAAGFAPGELVVAQAQLRARRSPGNVGKPDDDVLGAFDPKATLNILEGPQQRDSLTWWRVGGITPTGEVRAWVAEKLADGTALIARAARLPGTAIPDKAAGAWLGAPFRGRIGISQLWGERPAVYGEIKYSGVPLRGHNGIDFATPTGTELTAVDAGTVLEAGTDTTGFGLYVKLGHPWGESLYAHMESLAVQAGQGVARGAVLGRSDSTGFSEAPHLHFSIRVHPYDLLDGWGGFTDPLPYLNPADVQLPGYVLAVAPGVSAAALPTPSDALARRRASGYGPEDPNHPRP